MARLISASLGRTLSALVNLFADQAIDSVVFLVIFE